MTTNQQHQQEEQLFEAFKKFSGGFFVMTGKFLNRGGEVNEPRDPFEVVKGLQYEIAAVSR
jgi:hypothetical protein